jgi:hypothetical protein
MLSFQPGLQRQDLEVQDNLVVPRIELIRLWIECRIIMHRVEGSTIHPLGITNFPVNQQAGSAPAVGACPPGSNKLTYTTQTIKLQSARDPCACNQGLQHLDPN